ncbi:MULTISPECIES: sigma-70 family RNA polymerase sigma factor [unclassified Paracoccus (in: a-proteobacteria)]|uniref:sigma-70 family RNA polymerase sigma factor n=1 Tax=unclassified Paracoccus (in: a-proteobacteria) TaxID=2688777 RepID=UPI0012B2B5DB|nr:MULTISPECIES: sigma-70 family RNA polymerase sigma factor [unclassified Paracoccus (in: a-proteobacteria)]UXU76036.1 sigma-70 family RNA polymerase sigma factor [Paracoccus sp. SMMA_5]UXU81946.1 sigma-70 family RNA polymerase sigma factor [Paracoccus sp. SMMA_5_TC]
MTTHPADLNDLLGRVVLRDRAAFRNLYAAVAPKLFGLCLRILKDRQEAEDALQEVFVKIWHNADRYRPGVASPQAWLNTLARNHAIDLLRARRPGGGDLSEVEALGDAGQTPEESAITRSEGRRIDLCLHELPPPRAEAVRRAYVEGESYLELAERFAIPVNTLRSWLRRSLIQLRECLSR